MLTKYLHHPNFEKDDGRWRAFRERDCGHISNSVYAGSGDEEHTALDLGVESADELRAGGFCSVRRGRKLMGGNSSRRQALARLQSGSGVARGRKAVYWNKSLVAYRTLIVCKRRPSGQKF